MSVRSLSRALLLTVILIGSTSKGNEDDYCKGLCQSRYESGQDCGIKCCCYDFIDKNKIKSNLIKLPKRVNKDPHPPSVYYGVDEMHIPSTSEDVPPTAPMDF